MKATAILFVYDIYSSYATSSIEYNMQHPIIVIAVSLTLLSFQVDCVDTISNNNSDGELKETLSDKVPQRRLNSDQMLKMGVVGLGDVGHGHGHLHHPNKVSVWCVLHELYNLANFLFLKLLGEYFM